MDWQDISTAPRDGTVIEVMCTYGVAPWYTLARWRDPPKPGEGLSFTLPDGRKGVMAPSCGSLGYGGVGGWEIYDKVNGLGWAGGSVGSSHLKWRPYSGSEANYADPTGGQQNTVNYWRTAAGARPVAGNPTFKEWASPRRSWWSRIRWFG